ncbi:unnamed protein product [Discosporangium mesarthrocarpum]
MPGRSYSPPDYRASIWVNMVLKESLLADPSTHEASNFKRRFRLPFPIYKKLVKKCKRERWFGRATRSAAPGYPWSSRWASFSAFGCPANPWQGNCFDDTEMVSDIHESKVQACFHTFCTYLQRGCTRIRSLYPRVKTSRLQPPTRFPGAVGTCDVTMYDGIRHLPVVLYTTLVRRGSLALPPRSLWVTLGMLWL